jgi:hypothetical protein
LQTSESSRTLRATKARESLTSNSTPLNLSRRLCYRATSHSNATVGFSRGSRLCTPRPRRTDLLPLPGKLTPLFRQMRIPRAVEPFEQTQETLRKSTKVVVGGLVDRLADIE